GRALWASQAGFAYGGGLGVVLSAVRPGQSGNQGAEAKRGGRPPGYVGVTNQDIVLRPLLAVRDNRGKGVFQLRQRIDWIRSDASLTSRTTFYIGYRPAEQFGLGLEAWEVYLVRAADSKNDGRAAYAVSPSLRLMTRVLQPAISVLLPIDRPLFDAVDSFWALRLSLGVILHRSRTKR